MKQQKDMVESFLMAHREFMKGLDNSFRIVEQNLKEAADFDDQCTGEWCTKMESSIDELAKSIYSISEPRWLTDQDAKKIRDMRHNIHDIYAKFKGISSRSTH
jgi:sugar (pentulose or hexulose) kinase